MENDIETPPLPIIIDNTYSFIQSAEYMICKGRYHDTYYGTNIITKQYVAIKRNHHNNKHQDVYLKWQSSKYLRLQSETGIPEIYWTGFDSDSYRMVVMELFDVTLQQLFEFCNYKFTLKTILLIADKLLATIENIHTNKFIHNSINPIHFGVKHNDIYFVGFGHMDFYINPKTQQHIQYCEGKRMKNCRRYASINHHLGIASSRRDDLESIGYVLLYFVCRGKLPWSGLKKVAKTNEVILQKKMQISMQELCQDLPHEFALAFATYMSYWRGMKFAQQPNYNYVRRLFKDLYIELGYDKEEFIWDWNLRKLSLVNAYCRRRNKYILPYGIVQMISTYVLATFAS